MNFKSSHYEANLLYKFTVDSTFENVQKQHWSTRNKKFYSLSVRKIIESWDNCIERGIINLFQYWRGEAWGFDVSCTQLICLAASQRTELIRVSYEKKIMIKPEPNHVARFIVRCVASKRPMYVRKHLSGCINRTRIVFRYTADSIYIYIVMYIIARYSHTDLLNSDVFGNQE